MLIKRCLNVSAKRPTLPFAFKRVLQFPSVFVGFNDTFLPCKYTILVNIETEIRSGVKVHLAKEFLNVKKRKKRGNEIL